MKLPARISAFLPLAMTLVWLQFLPGRVPVHYDFSGNIDRWGSKWEYLLLPGIVLVMCLVFFLVGAAMSRKAGTDEKQRTHAAANVKVLEIITLATALMFTVLQAVLLLGAGRGASAVRQSSLPMMRITGICMGVLFVVLGNFMPRAKMNSSFGFRCGWTMYNDVTWQKSNRFGGVTLMGAGLVCVPCAILVPEPWVIPAVLIALTAALAACLIYARRIYREETGKE